MDATQRQLQAEKGMVFGLVERFIYAEHDLLTRYDLNLPRPPGGGEIQKVHTGFHMVDFGTVFRIDCNQIARNGPAPGQTKVSQLSTPVRQELRSKLASYFGRIPDEDAT